MHASRKLIFGGFICVRAYAAFLDWPADTILGGKEAPATAHRPYCWYGIKLNEKGSDPIAGRLLTLSMAAEERLTYLKSAPVARSPECLDLQTKMGCPSLKPIGRISCSNKKDTQPNSAFTGRKLFPAPATAADRTEENLQPEIDALITELEAYSQAPQDRTRVPSPRGAANLLGLFSLHAFLLHCMIWQPSFGSRKFF